MGFVKKTAKKAARSAGKAAVRKVRGASKYYCPKNDGPHRMGRETANGFHYIACRSCGFVG